MNNKGPKKPKKSKASGAPDSPVLPQMGLPPAPPPPVGATFSQSTTIDSGVAHDMKYRLVLKDDFAEDPPHGVIFVNKNVQNHTLTFKVTGIEGDVLEESRKIAALPANGVLDIQKLIKHKAAILAELEKREKVVRDKIQALKTEEKTADIARKMAIAQELEKENNQRIFRNKAELEQAALNKDLKKRLEVSKTMEGVMTPAMGDPKHSNAGQIQHLAGLSMESLAIKMNLELLFFFIKLIWAPTAGYAIALKQYEHYAEKHPDSVYDGQTLYQYNNVDAKGNFKLDQETLVQGNDITLDIILANGYLPKPTWLGQIRDVSQDYVIEQMGVDMYEAITLAKKHFHGQSNKPSHDEGEDNDVEDAMLANRKPTPVPRPSGK